MTLFVRGVCGGGIRGTSGVIRQPTVARGDIQDPDGTPTTCGSTVERRVRCVNRTLWRGVDVVECRMASYTAVVTKSTVPVVPIFFSAANRVLREYSTFEG